MGETRLIELTSLAALRRHAGLWDDLWRRSDVTNPLARCELVAQAIEQQAPGSLFHALVVEEQGKWVAALPLFIGRVLGVASVARTPKLHASAFLLDPHCDVELGLDRLLGGISRLPWDFVWLNEVALDARRGTALEAAIARNAMTCSVLERYQMAWLEVDHDWDACTRRLSRTFRKENSRQSRRLAAAGDVRFDTRLDFGPGELEEFVRRGFGVEHRSWKGRAGTSVLAEGMLPYYLRQARQLAQWGQLNLSILECSGCPVAFAYGARAKGVYHSLKIGHDEAFSRFSPGHLLHYNLFQHLWKDPECRAVDFTAEITDAQRHWRPATRRVGQIVLASHRLLPRAAVHVYRRWGPQFRRARHYLSTKANSSKWKRSAGILDDEANLNASPLTPLESVRNSE